MTLNSHHLRLEYRDFVDLTDGQAAQTQALYEEAFPARLRVPFDELLASARDTNRLQASALVDETVVAFYVASRLPSGWSFLEYIAVTSALRSRGLGGAVFGEFIDRIGTETPLVLEVEPPEDAPDGAEQAIRERRINFYLRLGMRVVDVADYVVPNIDGSGTERLLLLVRTADRDWPDDIELRRLVTDLYVDGYGLGQDHPLTRSALAGIGG